MIRQGRREKLCFFPGPFSPANYNRQKAPPPSLPRQARGRKHRHTIQQAAEKVSLQRNTSKTCARAYRLTVLSTMIWLLLLSIFLTPVRAATASFDEAVLSEVQALQELKEKQPAAYQQRVNELKENVKKDVGNWRTQKPEVYQRFMQRGQQRGEQHREFLRQKRPDLYSAYQRRHEERKKNRGPRRDITPSQESPLRPPKPARPVFEERRLAKTSQNPQPSQRQPHPSSNREFVQRPRMEAGNRAGAARQDIRTDSPGGRQPRQQESVLHSQDRPRKGPSNSKGFSRPVRQQERPRPRDSRQRS